MKSNSDPITELTPVLVRLCNVKILNENYQTSENLSKIHACGTGEEVPRNCKNHVIC